MTDEAPAALDDTERSGDVAPGTRPIPGLLISRTALAIAATLVNSCLAHDADVGHKV